MHRIRRLWRLAVFGIVWAAGMIVFARVLGWFGMPLGALKPPSLAIATAPAPAADSNNISADSATTEPATLAMPSGSTTPPDAAAPASPPMSPSTSPPSAATEPLPVGLLVGHWQYDSGTVCDDGLREVDITTDVALRTQAILATQGYDVDLLPEHDPKVPAPPVQGYRAAALVAIHADSCQSALSGFKVARWRYSGMPTVDDRLVRCLQDRYAAATFLPRNDNTISVDMWNYYAFREIDLATPAAIIELAFLLGDRAFVDAHRYEMALGVADGISCFLKGG